MIKWIFCFLFYFIVKLSFCQSPLIDWQMRYGGANSNYSYESKQTLDGGFIIGGRSNSNISGDKSENSKGGYDYWLLKIDASGVKQWDKTLGGNDHEVFYSVIQTIDGGYAVCGTSYSETFGGDKSENNVGQWDYWIVKLSSTGIVEWENTIGGDLVDEATCIVQTIDGGFLVGGYSQSDISGDKSENSKGENDFWIVKLNFLGQVQWDKTIGGSNHDILKSVIQLDDGSYILSGSSGSGISGDKLENSRGFNDYWIVKINNSATSIIWQKTIGGSEDENLYKTIRTSDNGFLLGGISYSNVSGDKSENSRGSADYWLIKLDFFGVLEWQKTIGGDDSDYLSSIIEIPTGGYLLSGTSASPISGDKTVSLVGAFDGWVIKINSLGSTIEWQKGIGGSLGEGFNSISITSNNEYFLSGRGIGWSDRRGNSRSYCIGRSLGRGLSRGSCRSNTWSYCISRGLSRSYS